MTPEGLLLPAGGGVPGPAGDRVAVGRIDVEDVRIAIEHQGHRAAAGGDRVAEEEFLLPTLVGVRFPTRHVIAKGGV
jgi:hypothetical protein